MPRPIILALAAAASIVAAARPLAAQALAGTGLRAGPQFIQYQVKSPVNETISELTIPVFVIVPATSALSFDVGTAYAYARYEARDGNVTSEFSGPTDTQVRANYSLGSDFVVLTGGVNLPTGHETANLDQATAASRIGSDFLSFPISNFGTGFGFTGGVAVARPLGLWNLGLGASMRRSSAYEPFEDGAGNRLRFQPGNEYRARAGIDRTTATGRIMLGLTYSKFGDDQAAGSIYNTGDRYIAQGSYVNTVGNTELVLTGWNLYRSAGTILGGTPSGHENIANLLFGLGVRTMGGMVQPTAEVRYWTQQGVPGSALANLGLRYSYDAGGYAISPSAGFSAGRLGASGGSANILGFRGALVIRLGQ